MTTHPKQTHSTARRGLLTLAGFLVGASSLAVGASLMAPVVSATGTISYYNALPSRQSTFRGCGDDPENSTWLIYNRSACVQIWNETKGWKTVNGVPALDTKNGIPMSDAGIEDIHGKFIAMTPMICPGGYGYARTYNSGSTAVGPQTVYHWGYFSVPAPEQCDGKEGVAAYPSAASQGVSEAMSAIDPKQIESLGDVPFSGSNRYSWCHSTRFIVCSSPGSYDVVGPRTDSKWNYILTDRPLEVRITNRTSQGFEVVGSPVTDGYVSDLRGESNTEVIPAFNPAELNQGTKKAAPGTATTGYWTGYRSATDVTKFTVTYRAISGGSRLLDGADFTLSFTINADGTSSKQCIPQTVQSSQRLSCTPEVVTQDGTTIVSVSINDN